MSSDALGLAAALADLGPTTTMGYGSSWNPHGGTSNCVWVTFARLLNYTVPTLESITSTSAPGNDSSGATERQYAFLINRLNLRLPQIRITYTHGYDPNAQAVGYVRPDGTGHCCLHYRFGQNKFVCYQHNTMGQVIDYEVRASDIRVSFSIELLALPAGDLHMYRTNFG
jgi:hypothetical protein